MDIHTTWYHKEKYKKMLTKLKFKYPSNHLEGQYPHMTQQKRSIGCLVVTLAYSVPGKSF